MAQGGLTSPCAIVVSTENVMVLLNAAGAIPDTQIDLHTRARRKISNTQSWMLSQRELSLLSGIKAKFPYAVEVASACPVYNCHGLVFGSRRTTVEYREIQEILSDDGYSIINEKEAREGDVVLYTEDGSVTHSGFVIGQQKIILGSELSRPLIWSKWGRGPEMIHSVDHVEFYKGEGSIQYYRLTRWIDGWRDHGKN